jgi:hypothetical protein
MIAQGNNLFVGKECPINTYGAAGKVYGWAAAPCKPCPRNMITDGTTRVTSMDVCVNDDGFGYASEGKECCAGGCLCSCAGAIFGVWMRSANLCCMVIFQHQRPGLCVGFAMQCGACVQKDALCCTC